jgi:superfamily II helicase
MIYSIKEFFQTELCVCDGCMVAFEIEDTNKYKGNTLCEDCRVKWIEEDKQKEIEDNFQEALNKLSVAQLANLNWVLHTVPMKIQPDQFWINCLTIALESKNKI